MTKEKNDLRNYPDQPKEGGHGDGNSKGLIGKLEEILGRAKKENMTKNQIVEEIKNLVDANRGGGQAARKPSRGRGNERDDKEEAREGSRSRSRGGRGRKDAKKEDAWEEGKGDDPWCNGSDPWAKALQPGVGKGK